MKTDTIYALASGAGRAGIAVIRVSGPNAGDILGRLCGIYSPVARRAVRARFTDPVTARVLDDGLVLWFPGPASFTGEDVAELHVHGGSAVIAGILRLIGDCHGTRLAMPGEFSRRAFENSKMDLTQAEGLADLVNAETSAQVDQARRQMCGELGRLYEGWRTRLLSALAHVEATIDFSDEPLPDDIIGTVRRDVGKMADELAAHLEDGRRGERLRDGIRVAIIGPPNVGKSSLLNCLARRDAAIVSAEAGTTRDVIEVHLDLGGYPVIVADTAGLRQDIDGNIGEIEAEGLRRTRAQADDADLKLAVLGADGELSAAIGAIAELVDDDTIIVINKIDLVVPDIPADIGHLPIREISARTGQGMDGLVKSLGDEVSRRFSGLGPPSLTRHRHREALGDCAAAIGRFLEVFAEETCELAAEDLRLAVHSLGRITGRVEVEDILDVVFRDFCIGK